MYQDEFRWVYFVAEIGQVVDTNADTLGRMLHFNSFSFKKPFLTLGLSRGDVGELHGRVPLVEVDSVEMRKIFENLLSVAVEIKKSFNFK
ncbi:type III chaperone protein ShcF [Erwinia tracheiphila]|uniref:type III chaperone protein ShcF n=1 Tax=Erwinia tracheiphila TaxID=65700 RepID=UPI0038994DF7